MVATGIVVLESTNTQQIHSQQERRNEFFQSITDLDYHFYEFLVTKFMMLQL